MELNIIQDSEKGVKDIIKSVGTEILNFLDPEIMKKSLKALKAIATLIGALKQHGTN